MTWVRAAAPFLLTLYLLVGGITIETGAKWFKAQASKNLEALGVAEPDRHMDDFWQDARAAAEPGALCVRALVTVLGMYLLLPEDSRIAWIGGLALLGVALGSITVANHVKPRAVLKVGKHTLPMARTLSVSFVVAGLMAATLKVALN